MKIPDLGFFADARPYLDNVRMQDWGGYIGMAILGYLQGIETVPTDAVGYTRMTLYLTSVGLYLGFSFSVNNCFDYKGDRLGAKITLNPIASGRISIEGGIVFSILMALSGLGFTWLFFGSASFTVYLMMLLLSAAYSTPPFRLKSIPLLDMVSHGLFFGSLIVLFGVSVTSVTNVFTLPLLLSVYNLSLILELRNQIDDIGEDSATGVATTAILIGGNRANTLFYGLIALHMAVLTYIVALLDNLTLTWLVASFFVCLGAYFYRMPDRNRFLLIIERVTPLVYALFLLHLIL